MSELTEKDYPTFTQMYNVNNNMKVYQKII